MLKKWSTKCQKKTQYSLLFAPLYDVIALSDKAGDESHRCMPKFWQNPLMSASTYVWQTGWLADKAGKTSHVASVVATSVRKRAKIGGTPTQALILSRFQSQTNVRLSERTTICRERAFKTKFNISKFFFCFERVSVLVQSSQAESSSLPKSFVPYLRNSPQQRVNVTTQRNASCCCCVVVVVVTSLLPIGSVKTVTSQL